jgi:hypothetical protein
MTAVVTTPLLLPDDAAEGADRPLLRGFQRVAGADSSDPRGNSAPSWRVEAIHFHR